jgi:hypothetical protein
MLVSVNFVNDGMIRTPKRRWIDDQMVALLKQHSGGPLGGACGPEFAAFEAIESTV